MEIGIFNNSGENLEKELDELKKFLENVCQDEKLVSGEFNIIIVDNEEIRKINKEYRGIDRETDVISFALEDDKTFNFDDYRMLGDIYISIDKTKEQQASFGHSFKRELSFLAVHGLLHLLGYDHMEKDDEEKMFKKQDEILSRYGIER